MHITENKYIDLTENIKSLKAVTETKFKWVITCIAPERSFLWICQKRCVWVNILVFHLRISYYTYFTQHIAVYIYLYQFIILTR